MSNNTGKYQALPEDWDVKQTTSTVPKRGIYKFYCISLKIIFRNTHCMNSFFPYKKRFNRSLKSKVVYKASCWDCDDNLHWQNSVVYTTEKLNISNHSRRVVKHQPYIADHFTSTGHNIKWDHFEILATRRSDIHCRIKESLLIKDLKPSLNENVGSEKLLLY